MLKLTDPTDCCGCTACASICSHDAITMKPDALGFLYPEADTTMCVDCGLCEKVCAFHDGYDKSLNLPTPDAYAARHKDISEVMKSRSGAAFVALSDHVLETGGVVYGAGYNNHFQVAHKRATTTAERDEFRGSKYVQSDLTGIFRMVKQDLQNGLTVLFSGTPCQTSGLNSYIGPKLRANLILIDLICHGVPGPAIWEDYLTFLENKYNETITAVNFRDKEKFGWAEHRETFKFGDTQISPKFYTYLFYKHIMMRRSCEKCHFTNLQRPSDMTLADFWGWQNTDKSLNSDDKGVSLILVNTEKGRQQFEQIKDKLNIVPVELHHCMQPRLHSPLQADPQRDEFERDYISNGFKAIYKKYAKEYRRRQLKTAVKDLIKLHILHA